MPDILTDGEVNAIIWSFTSVAVIITILRLYARAVILKAFGLDDALILLGQIVAVAMTAVMTWHVLAMSKCCHLFGPESVAADWVTPEIVENSEAMYASGASSGNIYIMTLPIIKCSVLAFYKRIVPSRKLHIIFYIIAAVIIIQAIITLLLNIFAVAPAYASLNMHKYPVEFRWGIEDILIVNSAFQVLYDVILLFLPLPIIFKTKFTKRRRVGLILVYMLCCVSLIATIIRLDVVMNFNVDDEDADGDKGRTDHVYWAVIEVMTAITCANFPAMPPLLRCIYRETRNKTSAYRSDGSKDQSNISSSRVRSIVRRSIHRSQNLPTHKEENRVDGDSYSSRTDGSERERKNAEFTKETIELNLDPRIAEGSVRTMQTDRNVSNTTSIEGTQKCRGAGFSIPRLFSLHPHKVANSRVYGNAAGTADAGTVASTDAMVASPISGDGKFIHRTEEFRVETSMV